MYFHGDWLSMNACHSTAVYRCNRHVSILGNWQTLILADMPLPL
jgi:hypothetical protein